MMAQQEIKTARIAGKSAGKAMLKRVQRDAACQYWRDNANAESLHAFGYWDGFLNALIE